jgi:hypothetical protein
MCPSTLNQLCVFSGGWEGGFTNKSTISRFPQILGFQNIKMRHFVQEFQCNFSLFLFNSLLFPLSGRKAWPFPQFRAFDETLFRIFAKHETRENAPLFRETFANFASFARSNFRDFRVSRKL